MTAPFDVRTLLIAGLLLGASCSDDKQPSDSDERAEGAIDDSTGIQDAGRDEAAFVDAGTTTSDASAEPSGDANAEPSSDASARPSPDADAGTADAGPGAATSCASAPTLESFGIPFLDGKCNTCHGASPRVPVAFDSRAAVLDYKDEIQRRVLNPSNENERMPPGGGLSAADQAQLQQLLDCLE